MKHSSGEKFLLERGLLAASSEAQQQVIGCLACMWSRPDGEYPYGSQIKKCTGLKGGTLYPVVRRLSRAGVITPAQEDPRLAIGRPPRTYLIPPDTELGRAFTASLEVPSDCGLENPPRGDASPNITDLAKPIIEASSREELEAIIAMAQNRIDQLDNK